MSRTRAPARRVPPAAALLAAALAAVLLLGACAAPTATPVPTATPEPTKAAFPVTVKDAAGQDFTLAAAPQKIVCLPIWATEMLFGLVDPARIAGISNWISDPNLSPIAEAAKAVETRVESKKPEEIVALQPDLVVLDDFNDFDGSLATTLKAAGIPVLTLESPTSIEGAEAAIPVLAAVTGESAKGEAMLADMKAKLDGVAAKLASVAAADRLTAMYAYASYNDPTMFSSYDAGTPIGAIIAAAGLVNVCDAPAYSDVSKEKVVKDWKPQVLVVSSIVWKTDYSGTTDDGGAAAKAAILADATLATVPAVVDSRIYGIPDKFMASTSQYMADAVVLLAKAAYPDLFK